MSNASTKTKKGTDWEKLRAKTDEEVIAAALSDPDAQPMTEEQLAQMRRAPLSKRIRRKLRLTQEQFAEKYAIPIGTVRDWDQGRTDPDAAARALLNAIAAYPDEVAKAQVSA